MDPTDLERAHLAFLAEEEEREIARHRHAMGNLAARRARAEYRIRLDEWRAARPTE